MKKRVSLDNQEHFIDDLSQIKTPNALVSVLDDHESVGSHGHKRSAYKDEAAFNGKGNYYCMWKYEKNQKEREMRMAKIAN